jgi:hypothetical protein
MTPEFPFSVCWQGLGIVVFQTNFVLQRLVQINDTILPENCTYILELKRRESGSFGAAHWHQSWAHELKFNVLSNLLKTYGGLEAWVHLFLTSALRAGEWSVSRPRGRWKSPRYPFSKRLRVLRTGMGEVENRKISIANGN